jgi:hypothetical protein
MSGHKPWFVAPDRKDLVFVPGVAQPMRCGSAKRARLIAATPELLSIAERWAALDGGAWHVQRHANEKAELLADTAAVIAKATGEQP